MAHIAYLKITGATQGIISKGCNSQDSVGSKGQIDHIDHITVLACQHDISKMDEQSAKVSSPLTITKPIDTSSPLLGLACSKQEHLQCEIFFYRTNDKGFNEHYYTIELNQAVISGLSFSQPHVNYSNDEDTHESISFNYKEIIWKHKITGTEGYDRWQ